MAETRSLASRRPGKKKKKDSYEKAASMASSSPSSSASVSFKLGLGALLILCLTYGAFFWIARRSIYTMHVTPLPFNSSLDKFSEGRALKHIWYLADEIGIRQEGSAGLMKAASYIKSELEMYKKRSSSNLRVEIDETHVNGSFNMMFLKHSISLAYKNHTNIAIRISAASADEDAPAVLVNGHFDSAIGSPGAGDCASCVAAMLELVRLIIDTDWIPPSPLIFLFNGAEEVFMVACHGFMTTHKWRTLVGALINVEGSGTGGPDLVCQSGPGSWPAEVYAKAAVHPMANTAAQDIYPYIPGDTDYRIFAEDFGDVPGLDIILLLESYIYHTPYDKPERMVAGSMQARGENIFSLLKAFTSSSKLVTADERARLKTQTPGESDRRPVFFDFLGWFMVYYPFKVAVALHLLPLSLVLLLPTLTSRESCGLQDVRGRVLLILRGLIVHAAGLVLAVLFPVLFGVLRLLASSTAMTWFAQPWMGFLTFAPVSVAGMLIPRTTFGVHLLAKGSANELTGQKAMEWGLQWGAIAFYSFGAAFGTWFIVGNGFLSFWWTVFILISHFCLQRFQKTCGQQSLMLLFLYIIMLSFPILLSLYFGGIFWQVVQEKMGMSGSVPQPYGFFVPDAIMAAITGYAVVLCVGPIISVAGRWLASPNVIRLLLYLSIAFAALSAQSFPYNETAPKRILLQHTLDTEGNHITESHFDIAVFDANSLPFVFKHIPAVPEFLRSKSTSSSDTIPRSPMGTWMALYPISHLFSESFRFSARSDDVLIHHPRLPQLVLQHIESGSNANIQRIYLELDLGSLQEVWAAVLNITGPLVSWSFSDQKLPAPERVDGGPFSYICRLTGRDTKENWKFWLEAEQHSSLRVDLAVLDQKMEQETQALAKLFPPWAAVIAASSYLSSYSF